MVDESGLTEEPKKRDKKDLGRPRRTHSKISGLLQELLSDDEVGAIKAAIAAELDNPGNLRVLAKEVILEARKDLVRDVLEDALKDL